MLQVNKYVQNFYKCLERGQEYADNVWESLPRLRDSKPQELEPSPRKPAARDGGCFACGEPGHWVSACPLRTRTPAETGKRVRAWGSSDGDSGQSTARKPMRTGGYCFKCREKGHIPTTCPAYPHRPAEGKQTRL